MVVTAKTDAYTSYTESDELGIVKGPSQLRGHVRFVLPRRQNIQFRLLWKKMVGKLSLPKSPSQ